METTRLHAPERPFEAGPTSDGAVLPSDVAAFGDALRREHHRFLSAIADATARLGNEDRLLAGTAALQHQLTRQFLDAQRSILLRHAETHAEIERIERDAEISAAALFAAARRRAVAMHAHPASGERAALHQGAVVPWASAGAETDTTPAFAEIVDLVFQPREPEGVAARRQLTELLDSWWVAEQQEARAKIDDAYARAAMRRHVAGVEAAEMAASGEASVSSAAGSAAPGAVGTLPGQMSEILAAATAERLDDVFTELLASLEAAVPAPALPPAVVAAPLADGALIRFEPSPVIATNGTDEAFQRFWAKEPVAAPARRTRWWQHAAIIVPATAVSSLVVAAIAWVG